MAVAVPVAVGIGAGVAATVAAGGISGTALGLSIKLRSNMKHTQELVEGSVLNLNKGDHISVSRQGALAFRHAIVVEPARNADRDVDREVRVVYHTGWKATARVESAKVNLTGHVERRQLYRHSYESLISYPGQEVAARALSFRSDSADRREVLRNYWPFFKSDEHFATWCHIGFTFKDGLKAAVAPRYRSTPVSDVCRLSDGDHVEVKSASQGCVSGIVVDVPADNRIQVTLIKFPSSKRGPGRVDINDIVSIIRYDYDIAVGLTGQEAKNRAKQEESEPSTSMSYKSADEFCLWCKTSLHPTFNMTLAGFFASSRMMGRVWACVRGPDEVRSGDHVAYNAGAVYYYQHAIVTHVQGSKFHVIYLQGNGSNLSRMAVMADIVDMSTYIRKQQLYNYFYETKEHNEPNEVIRLAERILNDGKNADRLPFKNPEHFAMWCKSHREQ